MSPTSVLSSEECHTVLQRWKAIGANDEERNEFLRATLSLLEDDEQVKTIADNIGHIAELAANIDKTFNEVERILWIVVYLVWPIGIPLLQEWVTYKTRWRDALKASIGMASTTTDVLKRFDEVYLAKVESIQTERDRVDAIALLGPFIDELQNHDQSDKMSRMFLDLKRDIEAFVNRFNASALETAINPMLKDIEALDDEIKVAQKTIAGSGASMLAALGIGAKASPVLASLQDQREKKVENIRNIHRAMTAMTELVIPAPAPKLAGEQITAPDIGLMLRQLGIFAELWTAVRSETVQFYEHLKGGLSAATNSRFKAEVKLAREESRPLQVGLKEYVRQLESWSVRKSAYSFLGRRLSDMMPKEKIKTEAGIFWDFDTTTVPSGASMSTTVGRLKELGKRHSSKITHFTAYIAADWTPEKADQDDKKTKSLRDALKSLGVDLTCCLSATADPFEDVRDVETRLTYDIYTFLQTHPNANAIIVVTGDPGFVENDWAKHCKERVEERQGKLVIVTAKDPYKFQPWADNLYAWVDYVARDTQSSTPGESSENAAVSSGGKRVHFSTKLEDDSRNYKKSENPASPGSKGRPGLSKKRSSSTSLARGRTKEGGE